MAPDDVYQAWVALRQTAVTLERAIDARLRPWRLSQSQAIVLLVLAHHGPQSMSHLAHVLLQQTQTTTDVIDQLERHGLVQRQHWHATDRRVVLVTLTDAGHSLVNDISTTVWLTLKEAFAGVSDADLAEVTEALRDVRAVGAVLANIPPEHLNYATERLAITPSDAG